MKQSVFAIPSRLYGVEYLSISAIPSRLYAVEYFCCSEQVMQRRLFLLLRSSRHEVFFEKGLRPATLLKKKLWYRCFSVNFVKFLRTPFLPENLWWLPLPIPSRLYQVEHFCYSEQVIPSRRFWIFCEGYIWSRTFLPCYSEQVILSRRPLLFQADYTKNVYNEQKFSAILCSLNQSEHFEDPKKVIQSRNFLLFFLLV